AESYFHLYRSTRDPKYQEYAWELAQAIQEHTRTPSGGYSAVANVNRIPTPKYDYQSPKFLSATLKYLYLTFAPDDFIPPDQWAFNEAGHPLPMCGKNSAYPDDSAPYYS